MSPMATAGTASSAASFAADSAAATVVSVGLLASARRHHPIRIGDERERLVTASPVMTKSRAQLGETVTLRTAS